MTWYYRGHDRSTALDRLASASLIACDTESVSLNDLTCIGIGLYISPTEGFYFTCYPDYDEHVPLVMGKLADPAVTTIWHNGNGFDLPVLDQLAKEDGYEPPDDTHYEDTSIWGQCSGLPGALQRIGQEWLGATDLFSIADLFQENSCKTMLGVPEGRTAEKCLNDCRTTYQLYEYLQRTTTVQQRDCYEVDRQLVSVLRTMQQRGLKLRQGLLDEHARRLEGDISRVRSECETEGLQNPGSPQQVGTFLAQRGNILPIRKGKLVADEEALEALTDPLAAMVLAYRKSSKLLSTYVQPWLGADRAYTHFRLDLSTGRLASGRLHSWDDVHRNLQNIPPSMREVFAPDSGIWTWADFSQIELRVLAGLSHDATMLDAYKNGWDMHQRMADEGKSTRAMGKLFNFAMVFGASDNMLEKQTKMARTDIQRMRAAWKGLFAGAAAWMDNQQYRHNGEWVEDGFGRRMRLPEMHEGTEYNYKAFQAHVGKCAVNYPVQGTAASIVKRAMLEIAKQGADMRVQVHDEFLVDGEWEPPQSITNLHPEIPTPFEVKSGPVWS